MGNGTTLAFVGVICAGIFTVALRFSLEAKSKQQYVAFWGWLFFSVLPLVILALVWAYQGNESVIARNVLLGLIGAVAGASGAIWMGYRLTPPSNVGHPTEPTSASTPIIQNITSNNQTGGITAGTVNITPQRLQFSVAIGNELLSHMIEKKPIILNTIGGQADQAVGDQIQEFLINSGFIITERNIIGMYSPPPDHKITFINQPDVYKIMIAPSAN